MGAGALILDLDGTLVDSIPCWIEAYRESLARFGHDMDHDEFVSSIYQQNDPLARVLARLELDVGERAFRDVRDARYVALLGERLAWLPGAESFLAAAPRPVGIVTNSWRIYVDAIDRCLGLHERVDTVVVLEDAGDRPKPHGFPLRLAAERMAVAPAQSVYVGDQAHDMAAARHAGMEAWLLQGPQTPASAQAAADRTFADLGAVAAAWNARG